jgi:hypothetical protein
MWFLFQSAIILMVVQAQEWWHFADHPVQVGIIGFAAAYAATLVVTGLLQAATVAINRLDYGTGDGIFLVVAMNRCSFNAQRPFIRLL